MITYGLTLTLLGRASFMMAFSSFKPDADGQDLPVKFGLIGFTLFFLGLGVVAAGLYGWLTTEGCR